MIDNTLKTDQKAAAAPVKYRFFAYLGIFLLCYTIFLIFTFPYDLLAKGIMHKTKSQLPVPVNVESISPSLPLGVKISGIEIGPLANGQTALIDSLTLKASLLRLISKTLDVNAEANLYGGKLQFDYLGDKNAGEGVLRIISINIQELMPTFVQTSWKFAGEIGGKIDFSANLARPNESSAKIKLNSANFAVNIANITINNVKIPVPAGDFKFTKVEADLELKKGGALIVKTFHMEGDPCGFDITGQVNINYLNYMESGLDLQVALNPNEEFKLKLPFDLLQKNDKGMAVANLRGTFMQPVFP